MKDSTFDYERITLLHGFLASTLSLRILLEETNDRVRFKVSGEHGRGSTEGMDLYRR